MNVAVDQFVAVFAFSKENFTQFVIGKEVVEVATPSKQFFPLQHFFLNGIPSSSNYDCAMIIPLSEILNSVVHLHPLHSYVLGNVLIPDNAIFIVPKDISIPSTVKQSIENYSPLEQTLQQKVEQFFLEKQFLICNLDTLVFKNGNQSVDGNQLDIFKEVYEINPNIGFGEPKWSLNTERSIVGLFEIANLFPDYLLQFSKSKSQITEQLQQGTSVVQTLRNAQKEYLFGLHLLQTINMITFRVSNMYTLPQSSKLILKQHRTAIIAPLNQLFNSILKQLQNWEEHEEFETVTDVSRVFLEKPELFRFWDADRLEDYISDYSIGANLPDAENRKNIFLLGYYLLRLIMFYNYPSNTLFAKEKETIEKNFEEILSSVKLEDNRLHLQTEFGTEYVTLLQEISDCETLLQKIFHTKRIQVQMS